MFEGVDKCVDNGRVKICPGTGDDNLPGLKWADCATIGAVAGESVKGIRHGHQFVQLNVVVPPADEPELAEFLKSWTPRKESNPREGS